MTRPEITMNMDCSTLRGHYLTPAEAASRAGVPVRELTAMDGAVTISGPYGAEDVYPEFQFAPNGGFVPGLVEVVDRFDGALSSHYLAGWLLAPQPALHGTSVVDYLESGGVLSRVLTLVDATVAQAA